MKTSVITHKRYKNAFNCKKCPQSAEEDGCPVWWEQLWKDQVSGEQVINKGCGFNLAQSLLVAVASEARRPASEISAMRKEIKDGVHQATVQMLEFQRTKEKALSPSDLEGHNIDPLRLVRDID